MIALALVLEGLETASLGSSPLLQSHNTNDSCFLDRIAWSGSAGMALAVPGFAPFLCVFFHP